jgi:GT2 family glycosyltransferase
MNNDVEFEPDFLKALMACSLAHDRAIVGSKILLLKDRRTVWQFGNKLHPFWGMYPTGRDKPSRQFNQEMPADTLTGMSVLLPAEVFAKVGEYDASFPLQYGDTDFVARAAKAGFSVWVTPHSIVYNDHLHSGSYVDPDLPRSWKEIWNFVWSIQSPGNPRLLFKFYTRHYPLYRFWLPLVVKGVKFLFRDLLPR